MKKILFAIAMLAISTFTMFGMSNTNSDEEKKRIDTDIEIGKGGFYERTTAYSELEAYLLPRTGEVEVNLLGIGLSEVYIIDPTGQIVDYTSVNTDMPSTIYLSTNGAGNYQLIIISETCYAVGQFTL